MENHKESHLEHEHVNWVSVVDYKKGSGFPEIRGTC